MEEFTWHKSVAVHIWIFVCFLFYVAASEAQRPGRRRPARLPVLRHRSFGGSSPDASPAHSCPDGAQPSAERTPRDRLLDPASQAQARLAAIIDALRQKPATSRCDDRRSDGETPISIDRSWRKPAWLILSIGGLIMLAAWRSASACAMSSTASALTEKWSRKSGMYVPVVRFRLPNGDTQEVMERMGAPDFAVGDRIYDSYAPQNPSDFRIDTFERLAVGRHRHGPSAASAFAVRLVAWALSRNADLALVGERAFAAIAVSRGRDRRHRVLRCSIFYGQR